MDPLAASVVSGYRGGVGQPDYGGDDPDPFEAERRAMRRRPPPLTGYQALARITEFRPEWMDDDEDDE